jgi:hypothetical protein
VQCRHANSILNIDTLTGVAKKLPQRGKTIILIGAPVKESLSIAGLNCCCLDIAIVKDGTKAVDTGMIHCII